MLQLNYDYATCVRNSERVSWLVDDVMPPDTRIDLSRPSLPVALSSDGKIAFLGDAAKLKLNQITGNAYLNLFAFVEEYIIATAVQHAQVEMHGDPHALRALVRFADEEIKHQQLFARYRDAFRRGFGHNCEVLGDATAVSGLILSKSPMAVLLVTLHLEVMTQSHYTECVRDDDSVDPLFARLLKHHWMEEAQHAKIDALELDKLVSKATPEQLTQAFADYLDIIDALDALLAKQARMDLASLARATGQTFSTEEGEAIARAQHAAYRNTFLVLGMKNRMFVDIASTILPDGAKRIAARAASLRATPTE